jgi:hypothetical protein
MKPLKNYLISILSFIIICVPLTAQPFNDNYVTIDYQSGEFKVAGTVFKPLSINYIIDITEGQYGTYYLSPHWNYSSYHGSPYPGVERYCYCHTGDDENVACEKLKDDMERISLMGFNVVRIYGAGMNYDKKTGESSYPTNSYSEFFPLMEQLLDTINNHDMKAIWVLTCHEGCFYHRDEYREFINEVSSHFKNNKTIMGYITCCEPFLMHQKEGPNDKIEVGNVAYEWYHIIKNNAPNHLVSLGLHGPETIINWDYRMMTYDFMTMHYYKPSNNASFSNNYLSAFYWWTYKNFDDVWIMGETGFSGTDILDEQDHTTGTEQQQEEFATENIQMSLDCNCKGYAWWQYQEVNWRDEPTDPWWENHLGLFERWYKGDNGDPKDVVDAFDDYFNLTPNHSNCEQPDSYYNLDEGDNLLFYGTRVIDQNGDPIKDAVVLGWTYDSSEDKWYMFKTFTYSNGYFLLYLNQYPFQEIWISALGYEAVRDDNVDNYETYTLNKINNNNWTKRYTNKLDNGYLNNWKIRYYDKFYTGDFDGDGKEELLCIQNKTNGTPSMYSFDNGEWTNNWIGYNKKIGDWTINYLDKFIVGNFTGGTKDELLAMKHYYGNCTCAALYRFHNGQWIRVWGKDYSGKIKDWELKYDDKLIVGNFDQDVYDELLCIENENYGDANMYAFYYGNWIYNEGNDEDGMEWEWVVRTMDKFYVGDIDGNNRDDLLCAQYTGGSNDWITFLKYDGDGSWTRLWSNNGSSSWGIYPYRNKLVVGNFDIDSKDEILGIHTWATKFDFINNIPAWGWSTGESKILSDWNINYNANCFFMRPIKEAPDYLFVIEQNGSIYNAEMFTMNYRVQGSSTILKSTNPYKGQIFKSLTKLDDDNIITYPNPASDYMNINIREKVDKCDLSIYDVFGKLLKTIEIYNNNEIIDLSGFPGGVYFLKLQAGNTVYNKKIIKK